LLAIMLWLNPLCLNHGCMVPRTQSLSRRSIINMAK
jgi:hypothetical protein